MGERQYFAVMMGQQESHLGDRKASQKTLKELAIVQAGQATAQFTLGSAWRSNEENVLSRQCCQQQQPNLQPSSGSLMDGAGHQLGGPKVAIFRGACLCISLYESILQ